MANIFKAKTLVSRTGIFSHEAIAPNLVYNTGYQNIDGLKDFTIRPTVGTIPVLLSGEVSTTISGVLYSAQINIKNNNGSTIYKGQPVYVSSAAGTNILVKLASNSGEQTSSKTLGLVYQTSLAQNAQGTIVTEGLLEGFNTNAGQEGDPIWLGPTGSLIFGLANKPYAPNHLVYLGVLTRKHANQGEVFVKIQNGFELEELHNVNINHRNTLADKNIIRYDSLSGIWFNDTIDSVLPDTLVYTTGDQTISGTKTFAENSVFGDPSQGDFLVISGNNFTVYGSGNFTSGLFVNGNAVLTGIDLNSYATTANLATTGTTLQTNIDNLSGFINSSASNIVFTTGNQTISGIKTFSSPIVFSSGITIDGIAGAGGSIDLRGGDGDNFGAGGSINLRGGEEGGGGSINTSNDGGSIDTSGGGGGAGGSINTSNGGGYINTSNAGGSINLSSDGNGGAGNINMFGGDEGGAGSINTSHGGADLNMSAPAGAAFSAGYINTSSDEYAGGGSIDTSKGGGKIHTIGQGQIQFGVDTTRTTLSGTATENRTIYLPNANGTLAIDSYVVFTTGNQNISGVKTFRKNTSISTGSLSISGDLTGNYNLIFSRSAIESGTFSIVDYQKSAGSANPANVTTSQIHNFKAGDLVTISDLRTASNAVSALNGIYTISNVGATSFQYLASSPTAAISSEGFQSTLLTYGNNPTARANSYFSKSSSLGSNINPYSNDIISDSPLIAPNLIYNTGNQNIYGAKTFLNGLNFNSIGAISLSGMDVNITGGTAYLSNRPLVNNVPVALSGETFFVSNFTHAPYNNTASGLNVYFANNPYLIPTGASNVFNTTIMERCTARKAVWNMVYASNNPTPYTAFHTGYFYNASTNTFGLINGTIAPGINRNVGTFTGSINPPVVVNPGNLINVNLRIGSGDHTVNGVGAVNSVDIYFYN